MDFEEWKKENIYKGESKTWVEWCELAYEAGQQSKQAEIRKAVLSLRNEFNLWADDTEPFHAIEAQIEQLEELSK